MNSEMKHWLTAALILGVSYLVYRCWTWEPQKAPPTEHPWEGW